MGRSIRDELHARGTPYREVAALSRRPASLHRTRALVLRNAASEDVLPLRLAAIETARTANVAFVINVSPFAAQKDSAAAILRWHTEIELHAAQLRLTACHPRPSFLMRNLLDRAAGVAERGVLEMPMRSAACNFVDARDVADVEQRVIDHGVGQRVLELRALRAWTYGEIAAELTSRCGPAVVYRDVCAPRMQGASLRAGRTETEIRIMMAESPPSQ